MAKKPSEPRQVKKHTARKQQEERQVKTAIYVTIAILAVVAVMLGYVLIDNFIVKPNTVVARVGDYEVKSREFQANTRFTRLNMINQASQYVTYFGDMGKQYALPMILQLQDPTVIGESVLNQLIDDQIIREEAEKLGITVSDEEYNALLREQFNFFPEGTYTPTITMTQVNTPTWSAEQIALIDPTETPTPSPEPTSTPEGWEATPTDLPEGETPVVEETPAGPTEVPTQTPIPSNTPTPTAYTTRLFNKEVKDYQDYLDTYQISEADTENILRMGLLRDKLMAEITKDLTPTEEQVWVRHILVDTSELAEEVIARYEDGESWYDLAMEYSTDESNKENGGDLGWIGRSDSYDSAFLAGSFALEESGQISEPVESSFGWHIIQLVTKAENNVDSLKFDQLKQDYFNEWLAKVRGERTDIVIEPVWTEFAPSVPAVPDELYQYVISQ
jgi:parvulin-like peptidyl-prolyl isomerase